MSARVTITLRVGGKVNDWRLQHTLWGASRRFDDDMTDPVWDACAECGYHPDEITVESVEVEAEDEG